MTSDSTAEYAPVHVRYHAANACMDESVSGELNGFCLTPPASRRAGSCFCSQTSSDDPQSFVHASFRAGMIPVREDFFAARQRTSAFSRLEFHQP